MPADLLYSEMRKEIILHLQDLFSATKPLIRFILYKRVFVSKRKTGSEKQVRAEKHVPVFPSQEIVTNFEKNRVSLDPCRFFPYTGKTGTQKTGRSFQRCPRRQRFVCFITTRRTCTHQNTEATQHNHK